MQYKNNGFDFEIYALKKITTVLKYEFVHTETTSKKIEYFFGILTKVILIKYDHRVLGACRVRFPVHIVILLHDQVDGVERAVVCLDERVHSLNLALQGGVEAVLEAHHGLVVERAELQSLLVQRGLVQREVSEKLQNDLG